MGWTNDQATTLNGQTVTYTNSTTTYASGSALAVNRGATFTVNGSSPGLGVVARNFLTSKQPPNGSTAANASTASPVITTTCTTMQLGRIYKIECPAIAVYMNIAGATTGLQITYTEDGTAPTPTSTLLCQAARTCPVAFGAETVAFGGTYTRRVGGSSLSALVSIWNVGASSTTVFGAPGFPIELVITDLGIDPGAST